MAFSAYYIAHRPISSMMDLPSNPAAVNLTPCSCMHVRSCLPTSSTKVTLLKSTSIDSAASLEAIACQHLSNSPTQAPASFPSTTKRVVPESMRVVTLSTAKSFPTAVVSNWLATPKRCHQSLNQDRYDWYTMANLPLEYDFLVYSTLRSLLVLIRVSSVFIRG
jgi:hypothetical protein